MVSILITAVKVLLNTLYYNVLAYLLSIVLYIACCFTL